MDDLVNEDTSIWNDSAREQKISSRTKSKDIHNCAKIHHGKWQILKYILISVL